MKTNGIIIAIDGPAGVGKSTLSSVLAEKYGYIYINTGAMYRAVAWRALQDNIDLNNEAEITAIAKKMTIKFVREKNMQKVYVNSADITHFLQEEEIGRGASIVSQMKGVRDALSVIQRTIGKQGGVVMEGRDIGTVIFPDADIKFFLSASVRERAKRRHKELKEKGAETEYDKVRKDLEQRDNNDRDRSLAPLKKAEDAIEIDTTQLSIDEVVHFMVKQIDTI